MAEENAGGQEPNENLDGNTPEQNDVDVTISEEDRTNLGEENSKKFDSVLAQKKHWRDKAQSFEAEIDKLKKQIPPEPKKTPEEKPSKKNEEAEDLQAQLQKMKMQIKFPNLKDEEIERAIKYSTLDGNSPEEVVNSDFFQSWLSSQNQANKDANATPSPSQRGNDGSGASSDFDNSTQDDIRKMSDEQYQKYQKHLLDKEGGGSGGVIVSSGGAKHIM